jgi:hypothetical protein
VSFVFAHSPHTTPIPQQVFGFGIMARRDAFQVGLIAVLGIVTSGVLEFFKDSLQRRRDLSRLQFDVLTELSRAYMDVKLERRKIQATGHSPRLKATVSMGFR